jgi:hypothetical protein
MTTTPAVVPPKPVVRSSALVREPATPSNAKAGDRDTAGEDRYRMIAEAAYFRAERRGFEPGSELYDWLAAEIEVDEILGETDPR